MLTPYKEQVNAVVRPWHLGLVKVGRIPVFRVLELSGHIKCQRHRLRPRLGFEHINDELDNEIGVEDGFSHLEKVLTDLSEVQQVIDEAEQHVDLVLDEVHYFAGLVSGSLAHSASRSGCR